LYGSVVTKIIPSRQILWIRQNHFLSPLNSSGVMESITATSASIINQTLDSELYERSGIASRSRRQTNRIFILLPLFSEGRHSMQNGRLCKILLNLARFKVLTEVNANSTVF
jgi:hypothetical protein